MPATPNLANVKLWCTCDGTQGDNNFTDISNYAHTLVANGGVIKDTAFPVVGSACAKFSGTSAYITCSTTTNFDPYDDDFTFEVFFRATNTNNTDCVYRFLDNQYSSYGWQFAYEYWSDDPIYTGLVFSAAQYGKTFRAYWVPEPNTWYRIAVSRSGTNLWFHVNDVQLGEAKWFDVTVENENSIFTIGNRFNYYSNVLYVDEIRIIIGESIYSGTSAEDPFAAKSINTTPAPILDEPIGQIYYAKRSETLDYVIEIEVFNSNGVKIETFEVNVRDYAGSSATVDTSYTQIRGKASVLGPDNTYHLVVYPDNSDNEEALVCTIARGTLSVTAFENAGFLWNAVQYVDGLYIFALTNGLGIYISTDGFSWTYERAGGGPGKYFYSSLYNKYYRESWVIGMEATYAYAEYGDSLFGSYSSFELSGEGVQQVADGFIYIVQSLYVNDIIVHFVSAATETTEITYDDTYYVGLSSDLDYPRYYIETDGSVACVYDVTDYDRHYAKTYILSTLGVEHTFVQQVGWAYTFGSDKQGVGSIKARWGSKPIASGGYAYLEAYVSSHDISNEFYQIRLRTPSGVVDFADAITISDYSIFRPSSNVCLPMFAPAEPYVPFWTERVRCEELAYEYGT